MRHFDEEVQAHNTQPVHVMRVDIPFLDLLWLFLKSSIAMALALVLTSWLWILVGTALTTLMAAALWLLGVPRLFEPQLHPAPAALAAPAPMAAPLPAPLPPPPPPEPPQTAAAEPEPSPRAAPVDPNKAATQALQRKELERRHQDD